MMATIVAPRPRGRPRIHPPGSTWADRHAERTEVAALADEALTVAGLLGRLAVAAEDFARVPIEERETLLVIARGDAIAAIMGLASGLGEHESTRRHAAEVRWMASRLRWPQALVVRRDAEELRAMAETIGRKE